MISVAKLKQAAVRLERLFKGDFEEPRYRAAWEEYRALSQQYLREHPEWDTPPAEKSKG